MDNSAPTGGDGTFEHPFNELTDADGTLPPVIRNGGVNDQRLAEFPRSLPYDIIFVNEGLSRNLNGTPLDPNDDLAGDLTGYNTGIALLEGQMLLGDGVQHIIPTVERGNYILCNNIDGLTPFISNTPQMVAPPTGTQPDRAAVTLADSTTVRGFNIVNSQIGILAPDPTPTLNNNDGVTGDITIERVNIYMNNQFNENDLVRNTGDAVDPDTATIAVPLKYGISILDSTASFNINNVNIKGQDVFLPDSIFDDGAGGTRVINFTPDGNLVAEFNVERGMPDINFNGTIDNEFRLIRQVVVDNGDPLIPNPILNVEFDTLSASGRALRVVNTTGGTQFYNGLINNVQGQGIMIDNADDTTITVNSMVMINQSTTPSVSIMNSDNSNIAFTNQVLITDPEVAGTWLTDNTDTEITFFDLQVTTPANQALLTAGMALPNSPITGLLAQRNSGGMINVTGKSFLDVVGGPALSLAGVDGDETPVNLNFTRLRSVSSADGGVQLANISGVVRSGRTTVSDSTSAAIVATSNDGAPLLVDFGQTTVRPSAGDAANNILPGFQGPGVFLQNNTGATFSFDQLLVTTGNGDPTLNTNVGGAAFRAIDGGTINFNSVPVLTAVGGPVLELRNVTGTFQNAPGLVFNNLTTIQRNGPGIIIDGVTNDVLISNAMIRNDRVDAAGNPDPAAGNGINILNTTAAGGSVTIQDSTVENFLNSGINIVDSVATIRGNNIFADPTFDANGDGTTPDLTSLDGVSVTATNGNTSRVLVEGNSIQTINGSAVDVTVAPTGTVEFAMNNNTLGSVYGAGAVIDGSSGGSLTVTSLNANTVAAIPLTPGDPTTIAGTGGVLINDVTFDSDLTTAGLQQVQGGNTVIGNQNNRIEGVGLALQDVEGTLQYKNLNIFNNNGTGLLVKNPNTDFTLITGSGNINTINGAAIDMDPTTIDMKLNSVSSAGAAGTNVGGANNSSGPAIVLDDIRGNLFIDRTTIRDSGTGILITNSVNAPLNANFGDTLITGTFTGDPTDPTNMDLGNQGDGVVLTNNPLANITFQGLDIITSAGDGLRVNNGGTVNFTGERPSIIANGGSAVEIDSLTRGQTSGAAGWSFNTLVSNNTDGTGLKLNNLADELMVEGAARVSSTTGTGLSIIGGDQNITLAGLDLSVRNGPGLIIDGVAGNVVINNALIRNDRVDAAGNPNPAAGNAINILNTTAAGGTVTIEDSTIVNFLNSGINIVDSVATIRGNTIFADPTFDINGDGTVPDLNSLDGISVTATNGNTSRVLIEGNSIQTISGSAVDVTVAQTGTVEVAMNNNTLSSVYGAGAVIDGSSGGSLTVTNLSGNTVAAVPLDPTDPTTIAGTGGLLINDATFDADLATAGLQQVQGGNTVIGNQNNRVGGVGLALQDVEGTLQFKNLNTYNNNGTGLLVKNPNTDFTLITGSGNINTTNGAAIDMDPTTINMKLNSVASTNAANTNSGPAILLDDVRGSLLIDRTTITDAGTGIKVSNSTSAALAANFGDTAISGTGQQRDGVVLENNPLALVEFQGLNIQTDNGRGLFVRDGGTVNFRGQVPNITANGGAAVDIDSLTRGQTNGTAGWTFNNLTSNGSGGSGVRLDALADDFNVAGTTTIDTNGAAGVFISGGLNDVNFGQIDITNRDAIGIQIDGVGGNVTIASANIDNANAAGGNAVNILNTTVPGGSVTLLGGTIDSAANDGINIRDSQALIQNVTVTNAMHNGINVVSSDAVVDNVQLLGNTAGAINGSGIDARTSAGGALELVVNGNTGQQHQRHGYHCRWNRRRGGVADCHRSGRQHGAARGGGHRGRWYSAPRHYPRRRHGHGRPASGRRRRHRHRHFGRPRHGQRPDAARRGRHAELQAA